MQSYRKVNSAPTPTKPDNSRKDKTATPTPSVSAPKKSIISPSSGRSTPKKKVQTPAQDLQFLVTGRQIFRRSNRACSLPGSSRRPSLESLRVSTTSSTTRITPSRDLTLDDVSLDLSQDSLEYLECIQNQTFMISTPKFDHQDSLKIYTSTSRSQTSRQNDADVSGRIENAEEVTNKIIEQLNCSEKHSISSPSHNISQEGETEKNVEDIISQHRNYLKQHYFGNDDVDDRRRMRKNVEDDLMNESMFSCSIDDSVYQTSSNASQNSRYRHNTSRSTDLDFSSASPEDSGQSSDGSTAGLVTASSHLSHKPIDIDGEWHDFWTTYNNSRRPSWDQCLTGYDKDTCQTDILTEIPKPVTVTDSNGIKPEGIILSRSEAENIIECAKTIGNVLSKAIYRSGTQEVEAGNTDMKT